MMPYDWNNHVQVSEKWNANQIRLFEESEKFLHPAIFVVSGVCGKEMKSHNENNHVQVSEKRSATSVNIIHIKSDSLKNQKKILHPAIFVVSGVCKK